MPQTIDHMSQKHAETNRTKRAYRAPHLRDYGDVRDLTQTSSTFNPAVTDGGTVPNIYAS